MFNALFDEAMYARLSALRSAIGDAAEVFVPVGAEFPKLPSAKARLMFIGKATRDFTEGRVDSFESARDRAIELLNDLPRGRWPFWQFAREITRDVLQKTGADASDASDAALASHCGWSNLAKIGARKGNPKPEALAIQAPLCVEALRAEIAFFKPTGIIIASTNDAEYEVLRPVFGNGWHQDSPNMDGVAWKLDAGTGAAVVWTNHPQGMRPAGTRAQVQSLAADLIVRAMQGKPLPAGVAFSP